MKITTAFKLMMWANRGYIIKTYGREYYCQFRTLAKKKMKELQPKVPDIGKSIYKINYAFVIANVPFFHAFSAFEQTRDNAGELLYVVNENLLTKIPKFIFLRMGKRTVSQKRIKELKRAQRQSELGLLNRLDWKIQVVENPDGTYWANMLECGALKVLKAIQEDGIFPYVCRIDYLWANLGGFKFVRTKTLADGDECCNNHIIGLGLTEWSPQRGFDDRK